MIPNLVDGVHNPQYGPPPNSAKLKDILVLIGLRALDANDHVLVRLVSDLLQEMEVANA
jgi:hypothetical protein